MPPDLRAFPGFQGPCGGGKGAAPQRERRTPGPRKVVGDGRLSGHLVEWKGHYGWIQPSEIIDHPEASLTNGRIFIAEKDVEQDLGGVGRQVSFICYSDGTGLGAAACRPDAGGVLYQGNMDPDKPDEDYKQQVRMMLQTAQKQAQVWRSAAMAAASALRGSPEASGPILGSPDLPEGPILGRVVQWREHFGWIQPDTPIHHPAGGRHWGNFYFRKADVIGDVPAVGCAVQFMPYVDERGLGAKQIRAADSDGLGPTNSGASSTGPVVEARKQFQEATRETVETLAQREELSEGFKQELCKRLMRYFDRGVPALQVEGVTWRQAVRQFVEQALSEHILQHKDRPWFCELDFSRALSAVAWALLQSNADSEDQVAEAIAVEFTARVEHARVAKWLWDVLKKTFNTDEATLSKIYYGFNTAYAPAYIRSAEDPSAGDDVQRAQIFLRFWVEDGVARVWHTLPKPEDLFTEVSVLQLLENIVHPPGEALGCIPRKLLTGFPNGQPPKDWDAFSQMTLELMDAWRTSSDFPPAKRAKVDGGEIIAAEAKADSLVASGAVAELDEVEANAYRRIAADCRATLAKLSPLRLGLKL